MDVNGQWTDVSLLIPPMTTNKHVLFIENFDSLTIKIYLRKPLFKTKCLALYSYTNRLNIACGQPLRDRGGSLAIFSFKQSARYGSREGAPVVDDSAVISTHFYRGESIFRLYFLHKVSNKAVSNDGELNTALYKVELIVRYVGSKSQ